MCQPCQPDSSRPPADEKPQTTGMIVTDHVTDLLGSPQDHATSAQPALARYNPTGTGTAVAEGTSIIFRRPLFYSCSFPFYELGCHNRTARNLSSSPAPSPKFPLLHSVSESLALAPLEVDHIKHESFIGAGGNILGCSLDLVYPRAQF